MENDYGLVSIIMPSYNCEKYIKDSIESVLNQSYSNWELIIVDDCSSDNTVNIIESFSDRRIRLLKNDENSGAALSRNRALREAKGKWISFLDSDDAWLSAKLEEQLKYMIDNDYSFTYTDYRICINDKLTNTVITAPKKVSLKKLKKYCYFATLTVIYDAEKIGVIQIGNIKKNNDYAMWLKALKNADAYRLPKCLAVYNKHSGSISSGSKIKLIKWHYYLFRNECNYSKIHAFYLTVGNVWYGFWKKIIYHKKIRHS